MSQDRLDQACEEHLAAHFGQEVDFAIERSLPELLDVGLVTVNDVSPFVGVHMLLFLMLRGVGGERLAHLPCVRVTAAVEGTALAAWMWLCHRALPPRLAKSGPRPRS